MKTFAIEVLTAAGYLSENGSPSEGLVLPTDVASSPGDAARLGPILSSERGGLGADAVFRVGTSPVILFKSAEASDEVEADWHRVAWNFGVAPLLWITTPQYVRLYNAYQPPEEYGKIPPLLAEFPLSQALGGALHDVEAACGRRHVAMGSFWKSALARKIDRRTRIDNVLLSELGYLLGALVSKGLRPALAQKLVGRCVFFQYLLHRGYLNENELSEQFGASTLHQILSNLDNTYSLFRWIRTTFNGDLFPIEDEVSEREQLGQSADHLAPLADFFGHFNIRDGQGRLFPFRFDAIPVELISSIYEKFVHMSDTDGAPKSGVHYTPINLVDLVLDPLFEGVQANARVLDPACGSGVFLVESLRRLVWLRAQEQALSRELIRETLLHQIRGVDVSPAALSVAAFSLYLAILELDPSPPQGIDALACLRFDPLNDRVLFSTSTFEPGLEYRLFPDSVARGFDIIVGNPPWTYSASEKLADRQLARETDEDGDEAEADADENADEPSTSETGSERSGTTYSRLAGLPVPPRSTDWAFLWRCRDLSHTDTRIALVMKATPFFSLAPKTSAARDSVLRAFPNVTLVNLSQLRTSRLFQEYEGGDDDSRRKKRAAGPAMLFLSNCLPSDPASISVVNFPWSSTFNRTGVFELPADPPKVVGLDQLKRRGGLLKAATFGDDRDVWFLDRLTRNSRVSAFDTWCEISDLPAGRGYRAGTTMEAAHLIGLPQANARDVKRGRLPRELPLFEDKRVNRSREPALFKGPLVLLPEGSLTGAPFHGRYTAVFDERDIAYNSSFVGVSFHGRPPELAQAFAAIMHSRLVAYQLALMGGTVGIKQTKIEVVDLENVMLPRLEMLSAADITALANAFDELTVELDAKALARISKSIDHIVESALGLSEIDRNLLLDADRRTRAIFFETEAARRSMEVPPTRPELQIYAENLCLAFNAFASEPDDHVLVPARYTELSHDIVVMKFMLTLKSEATFQVIVPGELDELDDAPIHALGGTDLPYLKPAKTLRLYVGQAVYILKPSQYRCFSPAAGQSDADRIVADLMNPTFPISEVAVA